jgi:putative heme transporter
MWVGLMWQWAVASVEEAIFMDTQLQRHNGATPNTNGSLAPHRFAVTIAPRSIWLGAALIVGILLTVLLVSKALSTLVLALLAIILGEAIRPLVARMERRHIPGPVAVLLIYVGGLVIVGVLLWLLLNPLVKEVNALAGHLPDYVSKVREGTTYLQRQMQAQAGLGAAIDSLSRGLTAALQHVVPALLAVPFAVLSGVLGLFISLVVVLTMTLFWLMSSQRLQPFVIGLFPPDEREHAANVITDVSRNFGGYVRGTFVTMLLIGLLTALGLFVLGVPYALLLGIVAGLTELLPYIGPWISGTVAIIVALLAVDPLKAIQVVILFVLISEIEGNIIEPMVMSRQVSVDPLLVIVSVLIGLNLLGVVGAILAVPIAAAVQVLIVKVVAPAIRRKYAAAETVQPAAETQPTTQDVTAPAPES